MAGTKLRMKSKVHHLTQLIEPAQCQYRLFPLLKLDINRNRDCNILRMAPMKEQGVQTQLSIEFHSQIYSK